MFFKLLKWLRVMSTLSHFCTIYFTKIQVINQSMYRIIKPLQIHREQLGSYLQR